jgi:hypothetical protein
MNHYSVFRDSFSLKNLPTPKSSHHYERAPRLLVKLNCEDTEYFSPKRKRKKHISMGENKLGISGFRKMGLNVNYLAPSRMFFGSIVLLLSMEPTSPS